MDFNSIKTAVDVVARVVNHVTSLTSHVTPQSYTDLAKLTSVEPLVIVSPDCANLEYMPAINQAVLSLFSGYYLQAVDALCAINDVNVVKILDKLNPNRDSTGFLVMDKLRNESAKYGIPPLGTKERLESYKLSLPQPGKVLRQEASKGDSLQDHVNMAVGRMLDVNIAVKDKDGCDVKANLRIAVRLKIGVIPDSSIVSILSNGTVDRGVEERYYAWRSGHLGFISDILFAEDIIREKYRMAVEDPTGTGAEILRRVSKNRKYGVLTNNPSMASASNIVVISDETAAQVGYRAGGDITNASTRKKIFDNCYAMIMVVVNRGTGRCRFFVRGQSDYATLSRKEIEKAGNNKGGPDVLEILRALQTSSFSNF